MSAFPARGNQSTQTKPMAFSRFHMSVMSWKRESNPLSQKGKDGIRAGAAVDVWGECNTPKKSQERGPNFPEGPQNAGIAERVKY